MTKPVPETAAPPFNRVLVIGLVGLGITLAVLLAWRLKPGVASSVSESVLATAADSPESFNAIQPFRLTERSGAEVTLDTLLGRPWIASFVFTRCSGPCPRISGSMKQLQSMLAGTDVRLVSFTVDPQYDTPAVLREYAQLLGADAERWLFLTGEPQALIDVSEKSFQLPVERDELQPPGQLVTHKTLLTVVDRTGRIRGYYDGETDAGVQQAAARADFLSQAH
jgi:cytochrome oxidase Cu insertion factor (SCO1/SenC/PrrC family)